MTYSATSYKKTPMIDSSYLYFQNGISITGASRKEKHADRRIINSVDTSVRLINSKFSVLCIMHLM